MCSPASKSRKLDNIPTFTHSKDENQYQQIVSTLTSIYEEYPVRILKHISEFATGIIVDCPNTTLRHNACKSGEIHHLHGNNFKQCQDDECDHTYGKQDYLVKNWEMHKYKCDDDECCIQCHIFECPACIIEENDNTFHAFRCLNFDGEMYPNHACEFASECKSIFCGQHWEIYGVTCDQCSKYHCFECSYQCDDENNEDTKKGYHCVNVDCKKYICANCLKKEPTQHIDYPFYCATCARLMISWGSFPYYSF